MKKVAVLRIMKLVKQTVVVEYNEEHYDSVCDEELSLHENIQNMYEDDKWWHFTDIKEDIGTETIIHEEVLSVDELK